MQLHFQQFEEQQPDGMAVDQDAVIIIPGLFGSITNWRTFAKKLSLYNRVIVVDQRNHGRSPHGESNTYADMVGDLLELCDYLGLKKAILCGHSMGGKVAMQFALTHPERVSKLLVLDIAPVSYEHSHAPFLKALGDVDLSILKSRKEADASLASVISDTPTRLFLLQNLSGTPGDYKWRINIPVLNQYMSNIIDFPATENTVDVPTLFLFGELSSYVLPEHHPIIAKLFSQVTFRSVAEAGHWLHADQPEKVLSEVIEFVNK